MQIHGRVLSYAQTLIYHDGRFTGLFLNILGKTVGPHNYFDLMQQYIVTEIRRIVGPKFGDIWNQQGSNLSPSYCDIMNPAAFPDVFFCGPQLDFLY